MREVVYPHVRDALPVVIDAERFREDWARYVDLHEVAIIVEWHHTKFVLEITTAKGIGLLFANIDDKIIHREDVRFSQSLFTAD
jgi:hypothetical protein